jgi:hypothetical protein
MLAVAAIIASCGGSDDGAASESADTAAPTETTTDDTTTDDTATDDATTDDTTTESAPDSDAGGGSTVNCDAIFSMAEVEEFLGEPAELTEEANDAVGQLVCTWETIEDPDDLDDLAVQSLLVQYYSGSPINGSNFFDPTLYESPTPIEGIGDVAYATGTEGTDYFFVDNPVAGSLNYIRFDLGSEEPVQRTPDEVEQLFRLFHDRVT